MPTSDVVMGVLAGLGLLFVGIKTVNRSLGAIAGDQLRRGIERVSRQPWVAALFGVMAGFVTQSGRTTAFIMASFVEARMINTRRALSVVLWSNFGCTLVIFAAIFPLRLLVLFLLAVAGMAVAFERPRSWVNASSAVFGLAMMLFGLQMMSSSTAALTSYPWFAVALKVMSMSLAFAFLTGLALTFLAQSHLAIVLITLSLAAKGLFNFEQALMVVYGAQVGASLITFATGLHFRGQPRQIIVGQILYNLGGAVLFLAIFAVSHLLSGGDDAMGWVTRALTRSTNVQTAIAALIFNTATPLLLTLGMPALQALCVRLSPPSPDEDLSQPQFLRGEIGQNTVATLMLAEQEQLRLLRRLTDYCGALRESASESAGTGALIHHNAFVSVSRHIARFQRGLMSQPMGVEDTEWLLNQQKRQEVLNAIEDACHELWSSSRDAQKGVRSLRENVVEVLDLLLISAIEAMENGDVEELELLEMMTNDHGATMERVRKKYLTISDGLQPEERDQVLQVTSIFERAAWSLRRFGSLLRESPNIARSKSSAVSGGEPHRHNPAETVTFAPALT